MKAHDLIEAYVLEVARLLPRKQRRDVAFELRALLREELQAKADEAGREADPALAMELLRGFGRPTDVAARYRPSLTIIDPADGHSFLRLSAIGVAVIWALGMLLVLRQPARPGGGLLDALAQWWFGAGLGARWWPGVLVVCFGAAAWTRRRWPQTAEWKPSVVDRDHVFRLATIAGIAAAVFGIFFLVEPRWFLDLLGGRAAPEAYRALTYAEDFRAVRLPWLVACVAADPVLRLVVVVRGRWSKVTRLIEVALSLALCGVLSWVLLAGPVYASETTDAFVKPCFVIIIIAVLLAVVLKLVRVTAVRPPDELLGSSRNVGRV